MEAVLGTFVHDGRIGNNTPTLLLHSCCAPCSSSVITTLASSFRITVFYYNPNIDEKDEYIRRAHEQERLIAAMPTTNPVQFLEGEYLPEDFLGTATQFAKEKEGGARCTFCYTLRLEKTALTAKEKGFAYFCSTLTVSPMKDALRINSIGQSLATKHGVVWLVSDFKKKDGFKKSVELSREYGLYRQDYCGCSFSRREGTHEENSNTSE